eukprot:TRINITY_DN6082_c0_g1_i1.p1 TRINITY_DN6082_c0_g1~~TRINITY_DN6082_c0_g1_i1.p1  ORF type:complete len:794 (+),score=108.88 TRINITY_DN6082_c0_g1_i1:46-2427(+)
MAWSRLQVAVSLVCAFDVLVCCMFLLLGAAEQGFLQQDVTKYSFYTSLIDVVAFAFVRSLAIPIIYIGVKVQTLIPLLAIAVVSTALMGVKIALLATLGKAVPGIVLLPIHYIVISFVALIGWVGLIAAKTVRDAQSEAMNDEDDEEGRVFLPPTTIYGSIQGSSNASTYSSSSGFSGSVEISVSESSDSLLPPRRRPDDDAPISVPRSIDLDGSSSSSEGPVFIMPSIPRLAALLLDQKNGIPLKEHSRFLKSYPRSFTGKEAIDWLHNRLPNAGLDRTQATAVLQTMTEKGYIVSLSRSRQQFDDGDEVFGLADVRRANLPVAKLEHDTSSEDLSSSQTKSNSQGMYMTPKELPRDVLQIVADLRDGASGLPFRDRKLTNSMTGTMTTYPRCFQGVEAIDWLFTRKRLTQIEDIKALLNVLIQADIIYDIASTDSAIIQRFTEKHYYRFRMDDSNPAASSSGHPRIIERALVQQISSKLKSSGTSNNTGMQSLDEYYKAIAASPARPAKDKDRVEESPSASLPKPIIREASPSMSSASKLPDSVTRSPSLRNFLDGMKMEGGVQTKQRKVGDRFYVPSFSGSDAVDWVRKEKNLVEREHAQRILQRLLRAGVIKALKLPTSTAEPNFDDNPKTYYYFADDEPAQQEATPSKIVLSSSLSGNSPWTTPMKTPARPAAPDSPASPSSSQNSPARTPSKRGLLSNFLGDMRDPTTGITVRDHDVALTATETVTYKDCFLGSEAVDWLCKKMNLVERSHAVKILQRLMDQKVILGFQGPVFQDAPQHYRFAAESL